MKLFTDGSCVGNGKYGAKGGYAVWVPEKPLWSEAHKLKRDELQTNNRAELSAIKLAVEILLKNGVTNEEVHIYTDSNYSINCLTKWSVNWAMNGWKTSGGEEVKNRDLIENISTELTKLKSYKFHYVKAHTSNTDELSKNNSIADKMATAVTNDRPIEPERPSAPEDVIIEGCPLTIMGAPISSDALAKWIRENINKLDQDIVDKYLTSAFIDVCKKRGITLTRKMVKGEKVVRAEINDLKIVHNVDSKGE
jgi:ribonuclease HI